MNDQSSGGDALTAPPTDASVPRGWSARRQRVVTGLVASVVVLAGTFFLPSDLFFAFVVVFFGAAAFEFAVIVRHWAPTAPLRNLMLLVPLTAALVFFALRQEVGTTNLGLWLVAGGAFIVVNASLVTLLAGTDAKEAMTAIGLLAFGVPYFALPAVSIYWLQRLDPWLIVLLLLIVSLGDTAAYFVGSRIGRRKMAPRVSPNKTWEGSVGGFLAGLAATAAWSVGHLGELHPGLLVVAAVTAVSAQLGDLVESLIKRGAGVKDSSNLLPGHGGMFDRVDAMLLAAPIFLTGLWILGIDTVLPGG